MGKIGRIEIKNYRGIKTGIIESLGDINVFVGKNGSGKSTILEPILLTSHLLQPIPDPPIYGTNQQWDLITKANLIFKKRNLTAILDGGATKLHGRMFHLIRLSEKDWWYGGDDSRQIEFVFRLSENVVVKQGGRENWIEPPKVESPQDQVFLSNVMYIDSSLAVLRTVETAAWETVLRNAQKPALVERFNAVYPIRIRDIDYSPKGFYVTPEKSTYGIYLDNLGAGMRIGMRLMILLGILRNTAILMEEFDAYEHPDSLAKLVRIIFEAVKANGLQLFLTTHRMESIRAFLDVSAQYQEVEGRIYGTMLKEDGELVTRPVSFPDARELFKTGLDLRNMEDYV